MMQIYLVINSKLYNKHIGCLKKLYWMPENVVSSASKSCILYFKRINLVPQKDWCPKMINLVPQNFTLCMPNENIMGVSKSCIGYLKNIYLVPQKVFIESFRYFVWKKIICFSMNYDNDCLFV